MNHPKHIDPRLDPTRTIRAPRGSEKTCKTWLAEAAYRMIQNNLDPEVAEHPHALVVYGGIGRAARNWECFDQILASLKDLNEDETLLVQSGKPVGVFRTHKDAPRVLLANSNLVPHWATWDHFNELDRKGLMMYGQMTAGSWIYIGSQGIVQGTYETFFAVANQHFNGDPSGRWILTGGLGGMGGAQPLAATMAGFSMIAVECDESRIDFRLKTRYVDKKAKTLDEALAMVEEAKRTGKPVSVGLLGNAADVFAECVARGITPDCVTDQTSAHDPINGYLPQGWTVEQWREAQKVDPQGIVLPAKQSMAAQVRAMLTLQERGAATLDYGNNIRQMALEMGVENAFDFPGFVPAYIRPLFCEGKGPFRWVALSGDPEDIYKTDQKVKELIPDDPHLHHWLDMARERIAFQGLPARICWVGVKDRYRLGQAFNEMVRKGELKAPIVIGRDHLDTGSVASPNRETESMKDGSDAVSDWPLLNALLNTAGGASWVSLHHGGGVGHGLLAALGRRDRRRRHGCRPRAPRPRAAERSGDGRDAPCRCRLRTRAADGPRSRPQAADAGPLSDGRAACCAGRRDGDDADSRRIARCVAVEERRRRDARDRGVLPRGDVPWRGTRRVRVARERRGRRRGRAILLLSRHRPHAGAAVRRRHDAGRGGRRTARARHAACARGFRGRNGGGRDAARRCDARLQPDDAPFGSPRRVVGVAGGQASRRTRRYGAAVLRDGRDSGHARWRDRCTRRNGHAAARRATACV